MISLRDVEAARAAIHTDVHPTPVFTSRVLGEPLGIHLALKAELLQKTGSFKPRGSLNRLRHTSPGDLESGIITVSAGNHAGGLAYAAQMMGVPCTVVMPEATGRLKVRAAEAYGAEVILHGDIPGAFAEMERLRDERHLLLVHPFDDPLVMAGQGTVGLEIADQMPEVDVVVVPVGGGGLIAGVATAVKGVKPTVRVYGVEPEGAPGLSRSLAAGRPIRLERVDTVVDSLAAPYAGTAPFEVARDLADGVVTLSDAAIVRAMREVWHTTKLYVEPAGASSIAALLSGRIPVEQGETVVAVLSGGNLDPADIPSLLSMRA